MPVINDPNNENFYLGTYLVPEGNLQSPILSLVTAAMGADNVGQSAIGSETLIAFREATSPEVFTDTISTASAGASAIENARYALFVGDSSTTPNRFGFIRTSATGSTGLIPLDVPSAGASSLSKAKNWATASNKSLGMFSYDDAQNYTFQYAGRLNNTPGYVFPTNSVLLTLGVSGGTSFGKALRPSSTSGVSTVEYALDNNANYGSNCSNGATTPTVSELYFRDDNATNAYPAIGYGDNLLIARGTFVVGNPYRVIVVDGTDANTEDPLMGSTFKYYVCVGQIGAHNVLMRVGE